MIFFVLKVFDQIMNALEKEGDHDDP